MSLRRAALTGAIVVAAGLCAWTAPRTTTDEAGTARAMASVAGDHDRLVGFLREMPKGGDLHNHLTGSIYAERYLQWASEAKLCIATVTATLALPPCAESEGRPAVSSIAAGSPAYDAVVDAWSMRHWDPATLGHDHFFAAFGKFLLAATRTGDLLADVASRAAAEHVSYLELMTGTDGGQATQRGTAAGWNRDLTRLREKLMGSGFRTITADAGRRLDAIERRKNEVLRCGTPAADPGCRVEIRFISQVYRSSPRQQVFAQMLAAFELATEDPRAVSLNLVAPEDDAVAVNDFSDHMRMLAYLHTLYPAVPITLHAGELAQGVGPASARQSHIRDSVVTGGARRIGHGVDVLGERDASGLLRLLAARKVLVEIALSSNDLILGVRGRAHPLRAYLDAGVPVALATDDPGISRSSHTLEFVKAVEDQGLDYPTLKRLAYNSIEYSFASGAKKSTLKAELDAAFVAFERRQAAQALIRDSTSASRQASWP